MNRNYVTVILCHPTVIHPLGCQLVVAQGTVINLLSWGGSTEGAALAGEVLGYARSCSQSIYSTLLARGINVNVKR